MKFVAILTILSLTFFSSFSLHNKVIAQEIDSIGNISAISAEPLPTGHSKQGFEKSQINVEKIEKEEKWIATDYIAGDVVSSTYTVQAGDTLWEISEAYFEEGIHWNLILNKNLDKIGLLPDGTRALIYPGQVLTL